MFGLFFQSMMQRSTYSIYPPMATQSRANGAADSLSVDRTDALHKSALKTLKQAGEALQDCRLQVAQHRRDRLANVESAIDLTKTWEHLDAKVVSPMEELQQRLNLTVEIVRDVYEAQVEMLCGGPNNGASKGLIGQLHEIKQKQVELDKRMQKIASDLEIEISVCAGILAFTSYKSRELTTGEREFKAELARYVNVVTRMEAAIESLGKIQVMFTQ